MKITHLSSLSLALAILATPTTATAVEPGRYFGFAPPGTWCSVMEVSGNNTVKFQTGQCNAQKTGFVGALYSVSGRKVSGSGRIKFNLRDGSRYVVESFSGRQVVGYYQHPGKKKLRLTLSR